MVTGGMVVSDSVYHGDLSLEIVTQSNASANNSDQANTDDLLDLLLDMRDWLTTLSTDQLVDD